MPKQMSIESIALQGVEAIYDAVLDPDGWQRFLAQLGAHFPGFGIAIRAHDEVARPNDPTRLITCGIDSSYTASYGAYYMVRNPWPATIPRMSPGRVLLGSEMVSQEDLESSEFYNDWAKPQGFDSSLGYLTETNPQRHLLFASLQHQDGNPDYARMSRLFALLGPHLQRAALLSHHLGQLGEAKQLREAALDQLATAMVLVNARGRVLHANAAAEAMARQCDGVTIANGYLRAMTRSSKDDLAAGIAAASTSACYSGLAPARPAATAIRIARPSGAESYIAMIGPMARTLHGTLPDWRNAVIVLINDRTQRHAPEAAVLCRLYKLTPAEGRLLEALLHGDSLRDVSEAFSVSQHTLKVQLRQLFAKTDTNRQSELIGRVLSDFACRFA